MGALAGKMDVAYADANSDSHSNCDANSDGHTNRDVDADCDSDSRLDGDADIKPHRGRICYCYIGRSCRHTIGSCPAKCLPCDPQANAVRLSKASSWHGAHINSICNAVPSFWRSGRSFVYTANGDAHLFASERDHTDVAISCEPESEVEPDKIPKLDDELQALALE
jgi:hypothetical protein